MFIYSLLHPLSGWTIHNAFSGLPSVSWLVLPCSHFQVPGHNFQQKWAVCIFMILSNLGSTISLQPAPVFLPGKFHGQRSLASYGPWGGKESDTTERLSREQHLLFPLCSPPSLFCCCCLFLNLDNHFGECGRELYIYNFSKYLLDEFIHHQENIFSVTKSYYIVPIMQLVTHFPHPHFSYKVMSV